MIFGRIKKLKEQLGEAENLVNALDAFIFVAKTDRKNSMAVKMVEEQIETYKKKWRTV